MGATSVESGTGTAVSGGSAASVATFGESEVGTAISGGSAVSAATSGNPSLDVPGCETLVVVNAAHTHQRAIPHMGNAADKGITSGAKGFESVGLGIPAACADTSGGSSMLDASLGC